MGLPSLVKRIESKEKMQHECWNFTHSGKDENTPQKRRNLLGNFTVYHKGSTTCFQLFEFDQWWYSGSQEIWQDESRAIGWDCFSCLPWGDLTRAMRAWPCSSELTLSDRVSVSSTWIIPLPPNPSLKLILKIFNLAFLCAWSKIQERILAYAQSIIFIWKYKNLHGVPWILLLQKTFNREKWNHDLTSLYSLSRSWKQHVCKSCIHTGYCARYLYTTVSKRHSACAVAHIGAQKLAWAPGELWLSKLIQSSLRGKQWALDSGRPKDPDSGKDWRQKKGAAEDEMVS